MDNFNEYHINKKVNLIIFNYLHDSNFPILQILFEKTIDNKLRLPYLYDTIGIENYAIDLINQLLKNNYDSNKIILRRKILFNNDHYYFLDASGIDMGNLFYFSNDCLYLVTLYEIIHLNKSLIYNIEPIIYRFFINKNHLKLLYSLGNIDEVTIPICGYIVSGKDKAKYINIFGSSLSILDNKRIYEIDSNLESSLKKINYDNNLVYLNKICIGGKGCLATNMNTIDWLKNDFVLINKREENKIWFKNQMIQFPICSYKL